MSGAWNRAPLAPNAFAALPIGSLRASGWLHEQLRLSAEGLTGHMMEIWPDVGRASGWLGGPGESWERGPYYARGLVALAHTLGDAHLVRRAMPWVECALASQEADGFFGPADNDDWWPRMPMLDALRLHHDATGDTRVPPFMTRYFRHQLAHLPARPLVGWATPRGGENIAAALSLFNRGGEPFLLELADLLHRQTSDWVGELTHAGAPSDAFELAHGVNRAMGLKEPLVYWQRSHDPRHHAAFAHGWQQTLAYHGQIQGTFSSDESLHGLGSTQGTELCTVVELLATLQTALRITGEPWVGDAMERIAYNALPAMLSADHHGHQYYALPNQVACTPGPHGFWVHHGTNLLFGPATGYGCCAANFHLAWPELVHHLWMATRDGGLAAMLFAPCHVTATVAGGASVALSEETAYPFGDEVRLTVHTRSPVAFPLALRIPGWATGASVRLNGRAERPAAGGAFTTIARTWRDGDEVVVRLPMTLRLSRWERGSVGIERGPLVYALGIGEEWRPVAGTIPFRDYELHPTTPWNYGLLLDPAAPARAIAEEHRAMAVQPWARDGAPVQLHVRGKRIPEWTMVDGSAGAIPETGLAPATPTETLTLIPFGCARLRISMFPLVR